MDTPSNPGTPPADLLREFVGHAQQILIPALEGLYPGGAAHVGTVAVVPDDLMPNHVGAFFITAKPHGELLRALSGESVIPVTAMYVTMDTAVTVAAALGGGSRTLPSPLRLSVLRDVKTQLKFVVHEATHSIGPVDIDAFDREVERTARAGLSPWKEALTELATERCLDDVIRASKLDAADPWLLEVEARDTGSYVGMVEAAAIVVQGLSDLIPGSDPPAALRNLVAGGCGEQSLGTLVASGIEARGGQSAAAAPEIRNLIAQGLTHLDRTYKHTLAELDDADPLTVSRVLGELRDRGTRAGHRLVEQIGQIVGQPQQASPGRRPPADVRRAQPGGTGEAHRVRGRGDHHTGVAGL